VLIAEIGNNHFGDVDRCKALIRAAVNSGADAVKLQAFEAEDLKGCSMPYEFYKQCELSYIDYVELAMYCYINFNRPLFFSIFSPKFWDLNTCLPESARYMKIAGSQFKIMSNEALEFSDCRRTIMSIPRISGKKIMPNLKNCKILHVSDYLADDPFLERIAGLGAVFKKQIGYSDHTIGPDACIKAVKEYGAKIVEKHFHYGNEYKFKGQVFRDTIHAAQPEDFEKIAKEMNK
jgi:sialic acid synthase SpsE